VPWCVPSGRDYPPRLAAVVVVSCSHFPTPTFLTDSMRGVGEKGGSDSLLYIYNNRQPLESSISCFPPFQVCRKFSSFLLRQIWRVYHLRSVLLHHVPPSLGERFGSGGSIPFRSFKGVGEKPGVVVLIERSKKYYGSYT
jgi:hypothetical protein